MSLVATTETVQPFALGLIGRDSPAPPLSLADFARDQLTPALGVKFAPTLQLHDVLRLAIPQRDTILAELAVCISTHGVVFLPAQDALTKSDLAEVGLRLGQLAGHDEAALHIHPTQELGENGLPVGSIQSTPDKDGRQISFLEERSAIASSGTHSDISFEPRPAAYTALHMKVVPATGGDTLFSSAYKHFEMLSPAMRAFLGGLTAVHDAEVFREQARKNGFALRTEARGSPHNVGDSFQAIHPVIRTNHVTGWNSLYVNRTFTKRICELSWDESDAVLAMLFRLQHESHDAQVRYRWSKNDVAIWDNSSTLHAATFDLRKDEPRSGDRVVVVGEQPFYNPSAGTRADAGF